MKPPRRITPAEPVMEGNKHPRSLTDAFFDLPDSWQFAILLGVSVLCAAMGGIAVGCLSLY